MRHLLPTLLSLALFACKGDDKADDTGAPLDDTGVPTDLDGDGYDADVDCDDTDSAVHPDATETCNGLDDDCDDEIDEGLVGTWYNDSDADGYGSDDSAVSSCEQPAGTVAEGGDCDDTDPAYNPLATEDDCSDPNDYNCDGSTGYDDADGDGFAACQDCNDSDGTRFPGAAEVCNEADDDCDGEVDEEGATGGGTFYRDLDADGYGDGADTTTACSAPAGYADEGTDCDDTATAINPGAAELCDGIDNNCDAEIDEAGSADEPTWYMDADADGYGDPSAPLSACDAPDGYSAYDTDCDDSDPAYNPAADESCEESEDYNCDGSTGYADADGDGWAACEECNDANAAVSPDAVELCNGVDDDCDDTVDEEDAADATAWYADGDLDTYGDPESEVYACDAPDGFVADGTDCDDVDDDVNPGATEVCDSQDDDCDGVADEDAADAGSWYTDGDGDGYGDDGSVTRSCEAVDGATEVPGDCDDGDDAVSPSASEVCNEIDDDCDGYVDDGASDLVTSYADKDGDGFGDPSDTAEACGVPDGYLSDDTDCDDTDADISPLGEEVCDDLDNDCDGSVDDDAVDGDAWYADADRDGYGDADESVTACDAPTGYVADMSDCDDADRGTSPGSDEVCDSSDNDCDGDVDEDAVDMSTYYADSDGDRYGDPASTTASCALPSGYTDDDSDCDDADAASFPGADEVCDSSDNDCDGRTDEDAIDPLTWYTDSDGDGYGDSGSTDLGCTAPSGTVDNSDDCDDSDGAISPDATEACDEADNDCDGSVDESGATGGSTWYRDSDGDGFGDLARTRDACTLPGGYADNSEDCDDGAAEVYPGAPEVCADGTVNDCDGTEAAATAECSLTGSDSLGDVALSVLSGATAGGGAGFSVASAGDVNGDGNDDVLIGAYHEGTVGSNAGAAYVVFGPVAGDMSLSAADATFYATSSGDELGQALASAGDMDGDGSADVLVTAPKDDLAGSNTGTTYLLFGPFAGDMSMSDADASITGEVAGDVAGRATQPAGDWDGDGQLDIAIGAAGDDSSGTWSGKAYVLLGPVAGTVSLSTAFLEVNGESTYDYAGRWMAGGEDLDGDGTPDLVVGAYGDDDAGTSAGAAYVVFGPASGSYSLADADAKLTGEAANDQAGRALAVVPDVDGDGHPEVLVGAWGNDSTAGSAGAVYLFTTVPSGDAALSTAGTIFYGATKTDNLGISVASAGDVNGDGNADLLIGAQGEDSKATNGGAAYVQYGPFPTGTLLASAMDAALIGDTDTGFAGWCVSSAGDTNGDGVDEILVGAYKDDTPSADAGVVYLLGGVY